MFWNGVCLHSRCLTEEHGTPLSRLREQVENVHVCLVLKSMLCCREQVPSPGVHHQPPEEVGPGDVVHGVLFGGDGSCSHLRIQMVWQHTEEARVGGGAQSHTDHLQSTE